MHLNFDGCFIRQPLFTNKAYKTTRTIAAVFHLAAIAVVDDIGKINFSISRRPDRQNLIRAHTKMPVRHKAVLGRCEAKQTLCLVEHHKVVTRPLHFGKSYAHGLIIALS